MRHFVAKGLRRLGFEVEAVASGTDAVARYEARPFDLCVSDVRMPGLDGVQTLEKLRGLDPDALVVLMTAYGSIQSAVDAIRRGAFDYVTKPFEIDELAVAIERALEHRALRTENRALKQLVDARDGYAGLVGQSPAMRSVFATIERLRGSEATVLIGGESGTGKEMVARALHEESDRAEAPFVVVNCGALPETLMESELFGHEKGAFTGATQKKDGLFRAAAGGTIFLDEIGELAMPLQVKLLRALQERKIRSVGGQKELDVDVRVVAATNRELEKEVEAGRFRQDLFYRLNVIRIHLPPLRERADDVSLLADHFVAKHGALQGKRLTLSSDARRWILAQPYPGNVRELENVIERAVTMALADEIVVEDLAEPMRPSGTPELGKVTLGPGFEIDRWLGDMEKSLLVRALGESSGSQTRAAKLLGTSFRSFRYRLQKYGLAADDSTETEIE